MKSHFLVLTAAAVLALAACKPAEKPAEPAAPANPDALSISTGVPECDTYLKKVYACISDKVPEDQRDMMKQGIEQSKSSWATVTDKANLAAQCNSAMEQAKGSFGAMGCAF